MILNKPQPRNCGFVILTVTEELQRLFFYAKEQSQTYSQYDVVFNKGEKLILISYSAQLTVNQ